MQKSNFTDANVELDLMMKVWIYFMCKDGEILQKV